MNENKRLFVGIKVSTKLQRELENAAPGTDHYFKENKPESLQIVTLGDEKIIGRYLSDGCPVSELDNVSRNIRSIITLVTGGSRIEEDSVRIYADATSRELSAFRGRSAQDENVA